LRNEQVLTLEKGHALNEQVRDICDACGAEMLQDYEGTSLDTLHHMVIMGLGIAFLPALYVKSGVNAVDGLKLLTIRSKPLTRTIGLVWRNSSADSETYQRIADHIVSTIRQNHPGFTVLDAPQ
jgi:LysR family hydrogen peroxide-inducible transcriptional activator